MGGQWLAAVAKEKAARAATAWGAVEHQHREETALLFAGTRSIAELYTQDGPAVRQIREGCLRMADRFSPFKKAVTSLLMDRQPSAS